MKTLLVAVSLSFLSGCAVQATGTAYATQISSPALGFKCFAIINGGGEVVGGNCAKE